MFKHDRIVARSGDTSVDTSWRKYEAINNLDELEEVER